MPLSIDSAVYLLLNKVDHRIRGRGKTFEDTILETVRYLVDYIIYRLNIHIRETKGGEQNSPPYELLFLFIRFLAGYQIVNRTEHFSSDFFLPILPKDIQVLGDKLISCQSSGRFLEECHVLILQHGGQTSSIPSIPASSSVLGDLSLGAAVDPAVTVRVSVPLSAS